jgi:outer membrane receptor protein involved in Fe transport
MNTQSFFTNSTISRAQLLKQYPQMTGLTQQMSPRGRVATNGVEVSFTRRFTRGWNGMLAYTGTKARAADWFPNPYDERPAWEESNSSRPHRLTASGMYQFPFGRRRAFFKSGVMSKLLGGMQLSGTFEYQSGPLVGWSNRYYYGDISDIVKDNPTIDQWFNNQGTDCTQTPGPNTGWERCSQRGPNTYQVRVFPNRISGLRRDRTLQTNANVQKEIPLRAERMKMILRFDMLNVFNRYQFDNPNADPMNTNFGTVQQQTAATNRFLQFQGRIVF